MDWLIDYIDWLIYWLTVEIYYDLITKFLHDPKWHYCTENQLQKGIETQMEVWTLELLSPDIFKRKKTHNQT